MEILLNFYKKKCINLNKYLNKNLFYKIIFILFNKRNKFILTCFIEFLNSTLLIEKRKYKFTFWFLASKINKCLLKKFRIYKTEYFLKEIYKSL
jgi:hypothetical protein